MMKEDDNLIKILTYNRLLYSQRLFLSLIIGFTAGISLGYFLIVTSDPNYQYFLYRQSMQTQIGESNEILSNNIIEHVHERENTTIAEDLYDKVKVLCWIITKPENHVTRANNIKVTWGKRCNKLIFISTEDDEDLGAIAIESEFTHLWNTTILTLKYIYENHLNEYDWFLKATEETYVVVENLRYMLSPHNTDTPIWFGSKFQNEDEVYNGRDSAYVLSRETIRLFNEVLLVTPPQGNCNLNGYGWDDIEIAKCLETIDIINGDSRDTEGRTRFHAMALEDHLLIKNDDPKQWFFERVYYKTGLGIDYSSDYPVSFAYVSSGFMFTLEYLVYHLRPFGIWSLPPDMSKLNYTIEDELRLLKEAEMDRNIRNDNK